jgi:hypothetical protein
MGIVGWGLIGLSGLAMFVFSVQILMLAFKTSLGWGLASLFVPFAALVFVIKYWDAARTPFLRTLATVPVYLIGFALVAYSAVSAMPTATTP